MSARNIKLQGLDEIFSTEEMRQDDKRERVIELSPGELRPFKNHPFQVREDAELQRLVESIKEYGVLTPLIVRQMDGGYELISGHRRKLAAELAGLDKLPVLVRNMTDDESIVLMVDSSIQRENLLPSEKAFTYKMKRKNEILTNLLQLHADFLTCFGLWCGKAKEGTYMKRSFVILMAAILLTAGCAKAPAEDAAVEKNTDQLAEIATIGLESAAPASEATAMPEAKAPEPVSPLYEKLGAPMRYEVTLTPDTDKLRITVDADVYLPNANGIPTVRVSARDFTQDEVTRLFQAFCGDTVMYKNRTQSTRAEIQEHIQEFEEELKTATGARREKVEDNIAYYKRDLAAAPETIVDEVCDGTLTEKQLGVQEYLGKYMSVEARECPENHTEGKSFSAHNNTYAHNTKSEYDFPIGAGLGYSYRPMRARLLDVNPYVFIKDESTVPPEALGELNTTPAEARALVEAFWAENGFSDRHVSAVWLADNRESEHLKLNGDSYGEKHAYLVACGQDINGVIPRINDAIWDSMRWRYESCMFVVSDMGIERFGWSSPHAYEEIVTADTQMLPFERIDEIFRKMMLVKYESSTHGNAGAKLFTYQVDRVALELQRVSEQGSADTGLLVPVWNFYGTFHYTYTDGNAYGSEIVQGLPTPLLSINAIDGSVIDVAQGY